MSRQEFPNKVKVAVIKRATAENGNVICEKCKAIAKRFQIDHVIADGLGGKPVIENAELICEPCYAIKNPQDTTAIAKAKRREARHLGAARPAGNIKSPGFKPAPPQRRATRPIEKFSHMPRRQMYREIAE